MVLYVHRNHKAWDGEPRTSTSTFTQLLSYDVDKVNMVLNVNRNHEAY